MSLREGGAGQDLSSARSRKAGNFSSGGSFGKGSGPVREGGSGKEKDKDLLSAHLPGAGIPRIAEREIEVWFRPGAEIPSRMA